MTTVMELYRTTMTRTVAPSRSFGSYQRRLFDGIPLAGRSLLDVGGGSGLMSFYAASRGARVVCLEPSAAGSNPTMEAQYRAFESALAGTVRVELRRQRLQDLDPGDERFDIILIHNAVNHLDETACATLPAAPAVRAYHELFRGLARLLPPGGDLIVADCGRRNLWGDLRLPNVFAPTIDWRIHQEPRVWADLLRTAGFARPRLRWNPPGKLRRFCSHRVGGYLTNSHFVLTMKRAG